MLHSRFKLPLTTCSCSLGIHLLKPDPSCEGTRRRGFGEANWQWGWSSRCGGWISDFVTGTLRASSPLHPGRHVRTWGQKVAVSSCGIFAGLWCQGNDVIIKRVWKGSCLFTVLEEMGGGLTRQEMWPQAAHACFSLKFLHRRNESGALTWLSCSACRSPPGGCLASACWTRFSIRCAPFPFSSLKCLFSISLRLY